MSRDLAGPKSHIDRELRDDVERSGRRWLVSGALLVVLLWAAPASGQTGTVSVDEENFRAEPRGEVLGTVLRGTRLSLGEARDQWREATLEAWIWARSVDDQQRPDLDLIVHADGENLRATPNGDRVGRAEGGMRLERLERDGNWLRVRRTGWIWEPSLTISDKEATPEPAPPPAAQPADRPTPQPAGRAAEPTRAQPASARTRVTPRIATFPPGAGARGVLGTPEGDTVATLAPGASVEVVGGEGEWTRVRIEGWVPTSSLDRSGGGDGLVLRGVTRDSLQARPERYRGRILEWTVQFIALQEAERFRTDFAEGEAFMLTRGPGEDSGFVYVAVAPDLLAEVQALTALQQVRVLARVRSVRSALTDAPVLELVEVTGR